MIVIIDYGIGNLRSVEKALQSLGYAATITKDKADIRGAKGIVLPGVGAFDAGMAELRKTTLESAILEEIALKKPFLGICLGMQLLFSSSEEGAEKGLNVFNGTCKKFPKSDKAVPQMGWNRLVIKRKSPILEGIPDGTMMYFANSYYPAPQDETIISARTDYAVDFASVITKDNVYAVQFHPEKSGDAGLALLANFGRLCK